jgi:hypothetical protein
MQNRIWVVNRLDDQTVEIALFATKSKNQRCIFFTSVLSDLFEFGRRFFAWRGIHGMAPKLWVNETSVNDWWTTLALQRGK